MEQKAQREKDLRALEDAMAASAKANRQLEAEIAEIRTDRAKLNTALIETAGRVRETEDRIRGLEERLKTLVASEIGDPTLAGNRRGVIIEVFAALQRMGRRPPPAVLVRPEDMLEAVRASILLGAVLPELRVEAEILATDLAELVRLKNAIATDRGSLGRELSALTSEQDRLSALIEARQGRIAEVEKTLGSEQGKAAELARQAGTLKELIDRMEKEIAGAQRAAEEARKAAETQEKQAREQFAQAAFRDPARLAPKIPFSEARGPIAAPCERRCGAGIRGIGRLWWDDSRDFDCDPPQSRHCLTGRWVGGVRRSLPVVWTTLDHQRGRRVLSVVSRNGPNQCRRRAVRARRRACGDDGRDIPRVTGRK